MTERLEISAAELIRSGVLAGLRVGQHRTEVRQTLGEPEEVSHAMGKSVIESYAGRRLQLTFYRGRLILIAGYFRPEFADSGARIQLVWDLGSEQALSEPTLLEWLRKADIPFSRDADSSTDGWSSWLVQGGATVLFEQGRLDSIQVTESADSTT